MDVPQMDDYPDFCYENDDSCPHCGGEFVDTRKDYFGDNFDCSCHINPPCACCSTTHVTCKQCGFVYHVST